MHEPLNEASMSPLCHALHDPLRAEEFLRVNQLVGVTLWEPHGTRTSPLTPSLISPEWPRVKLGTSVAASYLVALLTIRLSPLVQMDFDPGFFCSVEGPSACGDWGCSKPPIPVINHQMETIRAIGIKPEHLHFCVSRGYCEAMGPKLAMTNSAREP